MIQQVGSTGNCTDRVRSRIEEIVDAAVRPFGSGRAVWIVGKKVIEELSKRLEYSDIFPDIICGAAHKAFESCATPDELEAVYRFTQYVLTGDPDYAKNGFTVEKADRAPLRPFFNAQMEQWLRGNSDTAIRRRHFFDIGMRNKFAWDYGEFVGRLERDARQQKERELRAQMLCDRMG